MFCNKYDSIIPGNLETVKKTRGKDMHYQKETSIYDFVCSLSEAVDLVSPVLHNHHMRVAYISSKIALAMNLPDDEIQDIILASMLHDIGAFSLAERIKAQDIDAVETELNQHALTGYKLLRDFQPLAAAATLIKYHHTLFNMARYNIPLGSYIINLADRVSVLFDEHREILEQIPEIIEKISLKYHKFHPDVFTVFMRLTKSEYFLIEAVSPVFSIDALKKVRFSKKSVDINTLRGFAMVIAHIIDFRNRFTATHSSGVAAVARELTVICGFPERECKLMEIAGLLHDLGKLAVPNDVLEKPGKLNQKELFTIRKHTYYTYAVLSKIEGLEHISTWAAYHHEREDGNGYPFHIKSKNASKLTRIMAVADVITALTEDRPYRLGMSKEQAAEVLYSMAEGGGIDKNIVEMASENFFRINNVRLEAQQEALKVYEAFHDASKQNSTEKIMQSA